MSIPTDNMDAKYAAEVRARMEQAAKQRASITASGATAPTGRVATIGPLEAPKPPLFLDRAGALRDYFRSPAPVVAPIPGPSTTPSFANTFPRTPAPVAPAPVAPAPAAAGAPPVGTPPAGKPMGIAQRAFNATASGAKNLGGKTLGLGGKLLGVAGKVATPVAFAQGAAQSYGDTQNGYKENFDASLGGEKDGFGDRLAETLGNFLPGDKKLFSDLGNNALRTMSNVGDSLTLGYGSKLGSGLSASAAGGDFSEGFDNTSRDRFNALRNTPNGATSAAPAAAASALPTSSFSAGPPGDAFGPQDPNKITYSDAGTVAKVEPGSYQSNRLAEMGIPVSAQNNAPVTEATRTGAIRDSKGNTMGRDGTGAGGGLLTRITSAPGVMNLGSYGGDSNIYAMASTPGGRLNQFYGVGAKSQGISSAPETAQDKAYNAITKSLSEGSGTENTVSGGGPRDRSGEIERRYRPQLEAVKGYGDKTATLMRQMGAELAQNNQLLESARGTNAQLAVQGQGMRNTEAAGRRQDALTLLSQGNAAGATAQKAQEAADRQAADAEAQRRKDQETGRKGFNQEVDRLFNNTDGDDNKAREDREQFTNFVSNTDIPRFLSAFADPTKFSSTNSLDDIYSLAPPDRAVAIAALKTGFETKKRMGKGGLFNPLPKNEGYVFPKGDPVKSTWADVGSNKLPVLTRLNDMLNPLADDRVQHMEDGTVVPFAELADNNSTAEAQLTAMRKTKPRQPTQ